eukprot:CAMPEP_0113461636 /NCGR_PEP_ID=MMETSP0014_2-20120614/11651_1 /TAXON_ID=2857 /ORGANISM="Nitzschia sp." /LENGTH=832 /DNA_ID=CAMNT_0000353419 /DNA_START=52 /DNA_END=2547 /DNA_ORIENTATION=+ /assembly_acc=CAM_ASM_000159
MSSPGTPSRLQPRMATRSQSAQKAKLSSSPSTTTTTTKGEPSSIPARKLPPRPKSSRTLITSSGPSSRSLTTSSGRSSRSLTGKKATPKKKAPPSQPTSQKKMTTGSGSETLLPSTPPSSRSSSRKTKTGTPTSSMAMAYPSTPPSSRRKKTMGSAPSPFQANRARRSLSCEAIIHIRKIRVMYPDQKSTTVQTCDGPQQFRNLQDFTPTEPTGSDRRHLALPVGMCLQRNGKLNIPFDLPNLRDKLLEAAMYCFGTVTITDLYSILLEHGEIYVINKILESYDIDNGSLKNFVQGVMIDAVAAVTDYKKQDNNMTHSRNDAAAAAAGGRAGRHIIQDDYSMTNCRNNDGPPGGRIPYDSDRTNTTNNADTALAGYVGANAQHIGALADKHTELTSTVGTLADSFGVMANKHTELTRTVGTLADGLGVMANNHTELNKTVVANQNRTDEKFGELASMHGELTKSVINQEHRFQNRLQNVESDHATTKDRLQHVESDNMEMKKALNTLVHSAQKEQERKSAKKRKQFLNSTASKFGALDDVDEDEDGDIQEQNPKVLKFDNMFDDEDEDEDGQTWLHGQSFAASGQPFASSGPSFAASGLSASPFASSGPPFASSGEPFAAAQATSSLFAQVQAPSLFAQAQAPSFAQAQAQAPSFAQAASFAQAQGSTFIFQAPDAASASAQDKITAVDPAQLYDALSQIELPTVQGGSSSNVIVTDDNAPTTSVLPTGDITFPVRTQPYSSTAPTTSGFPTGDRAQPFQSSTLPAQAAPSMQAQPSSAQGHANSAQAQLSSVQSHTMNMSAQAQPSSAQGHANSAQAQPSLLELFGVPQGW